LGLGGEQRLNLTEIDEVYSRAKLFNFRKDFSDWKTNLNLLILLQTFQGNKQNGHAFTFQNS